MEEDKKIGRKRDENDFRRFSDKFSQPNDSLASRPARAVTKGKPQPVERLPAGRLRSCAGRLVCDCEVEFAFSSYFINCRSYFGPGSVLNAILSQLRIDTLSLVSKYLNGMEDILDDGDSMEARKLTVEKSKEELELFEALDHKSVIVNEWSHRVVRFKKVPPRDVELSESYSRPFIRFSLPCNVDGQGAWDAELDMADSLNYITKERFDQLGFVQVDYGKDFLVTSKSRGDFGIGEMRTDLTMLKEMKEIDAMLDALVENLEEVCSSNGNPSNVCHSTTITHLSSINPKKEKVNEVLDHKYKELEEPTPILEVLENYMTYRKKLYKVLMERARLNSDDYVNGTIKMNALADTGASMSVLPYCLFMNFGLGDPKPYNSNLTMADITQAKAMGEVKNVRIQIRYQAYLVNFLIFDIPMDKELPLLLGRPFFRTCGAVIDMGRGTLCIDDGVIRHTYFPKPRLTWITLHNKRKMIG
nr:hypothetical protein [Tanacetum cinerariifolium]